MRFLIKKTPDNFIKSVNDEISSILNRHFDNLYPEYGYDEDMNTLPMPVEITEKDKEYDIRAELPGVKKEEEICEDKKAYKKSEFKYGEFSRSVYLPQEIDVNKTEAKLEHGVLKIYAPKLVADKETTKKLTVK